MNLFLHQGRVHRAQQRGEDADAPGPGPNLLKVMQAAAPGIFEVISLKLGMFRPLVALAGHRSGNLSQ